MNRRVFLTRIGAFAVTLALPWPASANPDSVTLPPANLANARAFTICNPTSDYLQVWFGPNSFTEIPPRHQKTFTPGRKWDPVCRGWHQTSAKEIT